MADIVEIVEMTEIFAVAAVAGVAGVASVDGVAGVADVTFPAATHPPSPQTASSAASRAGRAGSSTGWSRGGPRRLRMCNSSESLPAWMDASSRSTAGDDSACAWAGRMTNSSLLCSAAAICSRRSWSARTRPVPT